jgi:molybdopterin molybdotransferase
LRHAAGRILAAPALANRDQPPFAASAMDGYALANSALLPGESYQVIGEAGAGHGFAGSVAPGQAVRIFTGAPVPAGAVRVVIQEDVTRDGNRIVLGQRLDATTNIRPAGADFRAGQGLAARRRLTAADLALIAAMNLAEVTVSRRPRVALIATGDELVMPGESPRPDQITASNSFALAAMAEAEGAEVRMLPIAPDTEKGLRFALDMALSADLVVTIGGASVGDHDLVGKVAADMGMERAFYKIAMRPGKPLMAGRIGGVPMLGLPGNPVSAIVCGHLFLLPALRAMQGLKDVAPPIRQATLASPLEPNGPRAHYMRARLTVEQGQTLIRAFDRQDSALLTILTEANALLIRPVGDPTRAVGDRVDFLAI